MVLDEKERKAFPVYKAKLSSKNGNQKLKVLVIGSGGREHALLRAIGEGRENPQTYLLPERKSVKEARGLPLQLLKDRVALSSRLKEEQIRLVVIGPEQPLVEGLGDFLRQEGFAVFGPSGRAAKLEGSKIFAKEFMKGQSIPTAPWREVSSLTSALQAGENFSPPYVLKANGLAGGKGVFICKDKEELERRAIQLFEEKTFGTAGEKALLEEFQEGREMSVFALTNGKDYRLLPVAQDYKRLNDGQTGPNTGGMGAVAPLSVPKSLMEEIERTVVRPTIQGLTDSGYDYRGVLYIGLMITQNGPRVLEYNVRFGDPEAQVILPLLKGSWRDVLNRVAQGDMPDLKWNNLHSACVALTSKGYPENPLKGQTVKGFIYHKTPNSWFLHAGVDQNDRGEWIVNGGRVLNSVAVSTTPEEALQRAYEQAEKISYEGLHYRKDIGSFENPQS